VREVDADEGTSQGVDGGRPHARTLRRCTLPATTDGSPLAFRT
jgi:hypothetical protein